MKQTIRLTKVHSKQDVLDKLQSHLYTLQGEADTLRRADERARAIDGSGLGAALLTLNRRIDKTKLEIADAVVSGHFQTKTETLTPLPLKIGGQDLKVGDRVRVTDEGLSNLKDWLKCRFSVTGTIVLRSVSRDDVKDRLKNSYQNDRVDLVLHVCFDVGPTVQLSPFEIIKIKPKVRRPQQSVVVERPAEAPETNVVPLVQPKQCPFKRGDRVCVMDNSIFKMMGYQEVTGEVFVVRADGSGFSMKCSETGALETVSLNDGTIEVL